MHLSRHCLSLATAIVAIWTTPVFAVSVTFNPNGFQYGYWVNGVFTAGTSYTFDATVDATNVVRTRGNTVTVGTFTVDGSGNIAETAAGLSSPSSNNVRFENSTITFNPGTSSYGYFLDWLQGGASGTVSTPMPKGSGDWLLWANGFGVADNVVTYAIDSAGNANITSVGSGAVFGTSGGTITFPATTTITADLPAALDAYPGTQSWGVHWIAANFGNLNDRTLAVIPGTWGLISDGLPAGSWKDGIDRFDVPGNVASAPWSQTLTWIVTADSTQHNFVFTGPISVPEPSSLVVATLGALGVMRLVRRRRR